MKYILDFMYHGEVNVAQEELNSFLSVAEELRVKGLTQGNNSTSDNKPKSEQKPAPSRPVPTELPPAPKRPRPAPVQTSSYQTPAADDDDIQASVATNEYLYSVDENLDSRRVKTL